MAAEIREIPAVVDRLVADDRPDLAEASRAVTQARPRWVSIVGRGTSDHAGTFGRYLIEIELGIPTGLAAPSVTTVYGARIEWRDGLVIAVSQSGRSPDVVEVVAAARRGGAATIAVTNDPVSPLAGAAAAVIDCGAGPERAVAATKTYVAQIVALAALVARVGPRPALLDGLRRLPETLERELATADRWIEASGIVAAFAGADRAFVVGRGYNLATALELALKLKETTGLFADGYSTADLQHGPIALAGPGVPVLAIRPDAPSGQAVDEVLGRLRAAGGEPWIVGSGEVTREEGGLEIGTNLPEALTPAAFALPGQLLAEAVARARGLDPDQPRLLRKITLTR